MPYLWNKKLSRKQLTIYQAAKGLLRRQHPRNCKHVTSLRLSLQHTQGTEGQKLRAAAHPHAMQDVEGILLWEGKGTDYSKWSLRQRMWLLCFSCQLPAIPSEFHGLRMVSEYLCYSCQIWFCGSNQLTTCCGPNPCVEAPPISMIVLGGESFRGWLGLDEVMRVEPPQWN